MHNPEFDNPSGVVYYDLCIVKSMKSKIVRKQAYEWYRYVDFPCPYRFAGFPAVANK